MTWLTGLFTDGATAPAAWGLLVLLIAFGGTIGFFQLRRSRSGLFMSAGRHRRPRLAVMDATAVDNRRKLVLVRRDGVEHLILIGGTNDLVVETNIDASVAAAEAEAAQAKRQERGRSRRQPAPKPQVAPQPHTGQITTDNATAPATPANAGQTQQPAAHAATNGVAKETGSAAPATAAGAALAASAIAPMSHPPAGEPMAAPPTTPALNGPAIEQPPGAPDAADLPAVGVAAAGAPTALDEAIYALGSDVVDQATPPAAEADSEATIEAATDALTEMLNAEAPLNGEWQDAAGQASPEAQQDASPSPANADAAPAVPEDNTLIPPSQPLETGEERVSGAADPTEIAPVTPANAIEQQPAQQAGNAVEPTQPPAAAPDLPPVSPGMGRPEPHTAASQPASAEAASLPPVETTSPEPTPPAEEQTASNVTPLARFLAPTPGETPPAASNSDTPSAPPQSEPTANVELDEAAKSHIEAGQPAEKPASADKADDLKSEMERLLDQLVNATRAHK